MTPKYEHITVELVGTNGNAFALLGKVTRELRKHKVSQEEIEEFQNKAKQGDYDHLLRTIMETVNVE